MPKDHPSLLYVVDDPRGADAVVASLRAGGFGVTVATPNEVGESSRKYDVLALDPALEGCLAVVARLASSGSAATFFFRVTGEIPAPSRVGRDPGIAGYGTIADLVALAPTVGRTKAAPRVQFTTVLRAAWMGRVTCCIRILARSDKPADGQRARAFVELWVERGEPIDAVFGDARGVDAMARLVAASGIPLISDEAPRVEVVGARPPLARERTIRCGMPTLLYLFDDDPFSDAPEDDVDFDVDTMNEWLAELDEPRRVGASLVARALEIEGVREAIAIDTTGTYPPGSPRAELSGLWRALAHTGDADPLADDVEEVVISGDDRFEVLLRGAEPRVVLYLRFDRPGRNLALVRRALGSLGATQGAQATPPRLASQDSRASGTTP